MELPLEFIMPLREELLVKYARHQKWRSVSRTLIIVGILYLLYLLTNVNEILADGTAALLTYLLPIVLVLGFYAALLYWRIGVAAQKQYRAHPSIGAVRAYTLTRESLGYASEMSNAEMNWRLFTHAEVTKDWIALHQPGGPVLILDSEELEVERLTAVKELLLEKELIG